MSEETQPERCWRCGAERDPDPDPDPPAEDHDRVWIWFCGLHPDYAIHASAISEHEHEDELCPICHASLDRYEYVPAKYREALERIARRKASRAISSGKITIRPRRQT